MDIKETSSGKIVTAPTGYKSFIPNPLPPSFELDKDLMNSLSRADYILGKLSMEGSRLPNPRILIRPFVFREAVLSSQIEGTQTTLGEMLAHDAGIKVSRSEDELKEIKNYISALDYGILRLNELPLSLRLIKEIHEKLMHGVRGSHANPGEFRKTQNWIGSPGCTLNTAKYVPPLPDVLMDCLGDFEKFLHDITLPPLIHAALCHYQFEAIHPFLDGNGRVGRLLITLLLIKRKILSSPILYLSAFFEATRDQYYKHLFEISSKAAWNDWFLYFLNGISIQGQDVLSRAERINSLIDDWKSKLVKSHNRVINDIITALASNPYCTTKQTAEKFGIAFTTAQRGIIKLKDLGILKETSHGKRNKVYCAKDILNILEEPTKIDNHSDLI